ncbi:MAG: hypothetical protein IT165_03210 [Bryobacterales bacterium]|nr:hypothetical protein [Bryobacterales bacterium]
MTGAANEEMFACDWSMPPQDSPLAPALSRLSAEALSSSHFGGALYSNFLAQGLSHFFPAARLEADGRRGLARADLQCDCKAARIKRDQVLLDWLGQGYALRRARRPFTESERRLIHAIGRVLTARYQALFNPGIAAENFHLFHGLPEDRYVSAFLDPAPYENLETLAGQQDRVADAIEVLRSSALTTHENRRVSTGALLLGRRSPTLHPANDGLRYSSALTSIRSFPRLCDGIHTVALVNAKGRWIDIVGLEEWPGSAGKGSLPLPSPSAYRAHCRATLGNDNLCLTLTPNGEIKAFAGGVQVFSFLNGCWRLTDFEWKYRRWAEAVGNADLAKLVLQVALDLADSRRGGLFAILDDAASAGRLVSPADLLVHEEREAPEVQGADSKRSLYYLLDGKRTANLSPAVLRPLAAIDGGVVFDREGRLLAFGAILRHNENEAASGRATQGGGRTVAASAASHYGSALKISEDGVISFFEKGNWVWDV